MRDLRIGDWSRSLAAPLAVGRRLLEPDQHRDGRG
jgi:hypothetical protein